MCLQRAALVQRYEQKSKAVAACLLGALCSAPSAAADVNGYGVVTTDYVFRGVTYSDGHAAVQAAVDLDFDSGFYLGLWGSSVDLYGGAGRQRDLEVDYYLGFNYEWRRNWIVGVNVVAYTFPDTSGDVDYNYFEYSLVGNYDDRVWLEYSWSPDLFHTGRETRNIELYAEWPLPADVMLGAGMGYYDTSELTGIGYGYWQAGVTKAFGIVDFDVRYHDTNRAVPIISTPDNSDARLALSIKIPF